MRSNTLLHGYYLLWAVYSLSACIAFNRVCRLRWIERLGLWRIGRDSMNHYVTHWIVITAVCAFVRHTAGDAANWQTAVAMGTACIILLPAANHVIKSAESRK